MYLPLTFDRIFKDKRNDFAIEMSCSDNKSGVTFMKKYIMALDQGTTSSRCIIFDRQGNMKAVTQKEFTQYFPQNGWVEQKPSEIWSSQFAVMMEAKASIGITGADIAAIGITNQRETTIVWDKCTGEPVYNAIVWQCRRTADMVEKLKAEGVAELIREKTGLIIDPYFSATKLAWILDNVEGVRERAERGELMFGTVDTWLIYKLTDGKVFATDYTNASRTMMFNIHTLEWDEDILKLLNIPSCMLPEVKESSIVFGYTDREIFGDEVAIAGVAGDQQAALFGQCCFEPGEVKNTYGTGCFLLMNTGEKPVASKNGLLTTIAASESSKVKYALEGSVFVAGAAIKWLRDELKLIDTASETNEICSSVEDTNGVYMVPAFTGLGAPYWDAYARGAVFGLSRGTSRAHFVRAVVESLAYQTLDVLKAMEEDSGLDINELKVDGGASANDFLMQFQSDILGGRILRPEVIETTALGAAYLAGLAVGYYKDLDEIKANQRIKNSFEASIDNERRNSLYEGWKAAVAKLLG